MTGSPRVTLLSLFASLLACGDPTTSAEGDGETAGEGDATGDEGTTGDGDGDSPLAFEGGSRLVPRTLASAEDPVYVAQLLGWHDQELELDCGFVDTVEGDVRCLPIDTQVGRGFTSSDCAPGTEIAIISNQAFECDQGLVVYGQNSPDADPSCDEWWPEYGTLELGPAVEVTEHYRIDGDGNCFVDVPPSPDWSANFCQYSEAPLSGFVRADIVPLAVGAIERHTLVGEDGSQQIWAGHDPEIGHDVYPDRGRLLPSVGGVSESFSDAACTEPAACGQLCGGDITLLWDEGLCAADVARVGVTELAGYYSTDDGCMALMPDPSLSCYAITEVRPPLVYESQPFGTGRLQLSWARYADTPLVPDGNFYDSVLETPCRVIEPSPGEFECRNTALMQSVFSDPECVVRIGAEHLDGYCKPAPATVDGPDGPLRVNPLPEFDGPTYTRNGQPDDGPAFNCTELVEPPAIYELVAAEVGWATLVSLP